MKVYVVILANTTIAGVYGSQVFALQEAHALGGQVVEFVVVAKPRGKKEGG